MSGAAPESQEYLQLMREFVTSAQDSAKRLERLTWALTALTVVTAVAAVLALVG